MIYNWLEAKKATPIDLVMRAVDAALNGYGIKDQVRISVSGGETSPTYDITTLIIGYDVLDPDIDQEVFRILEDLAVSFASSQRYIIYVDKLREHGI